MVDISVESREATESRLRCVVQRARLEVHDGLYAFDEFAAVDFARSARLDALALVRDGDRWSQLVPCGNDAGEPFMVWSFHFPADMDNSGFVGWLASRLKDRFGTGLIVTCGYHAAQGGVFDYWGCPAAIRDVVAAELGALLAGTAV